MPTTHAFPEFPTRRRMASSLKCFAARDAGDGGNGGSGGGGVSKARVWRPIEDMPAQFDDKARAAEEELRAMAKKWRKQKAEMDPQELEKFHQELHREWALETGFFESARQLERVPIMLLIARGFEEEFIPRRDGQDPARIVAMLRDHFNVLAEVFELAADGGELSVDRIKRLRAQMLRSQKTTAAGAPEGGAHEHCPREQVDGEMDRLMEMHKTHSARSALARAAWLHHRFAQIHPFESGNEGIARCLASLVFIRAGLFPLVIVKEARGEYQSALDAANQGDLSPLMRAFAECQKRAHFKTVLVEKVSESMLMKLEIREIPSDTVENVLAKIDKARELILLRNEFMRAKGGMYWEGVMDVDHADNLRDLAKEVPDVCDDPEKRREMLARCGKFADEMAEMGTLRVRDLS